ncbi:hypothetical protein K439DRAFT_1661209 [Ramaria rubella]|nr:hypothetical protein K439DRAFT_1661209 [Ramaria rubella]
MNSWCLPIIVGDRTDLMHCRLVCRQFNDVASHWVWRRIACNLLLSSHPHIWEHLREHPDVAKHVRLISTKLLLGPQGQADQARHSMSTSLVGSLSFPNLRVLDITDGESGGFSGKELGVLIRGDEIEVTRLEISEGYEVHPKCRISLTALLQASSIHSLYTSAWNVENYSNV